MSKKANLYRQISMNEIERERIINKWITRLGSFKLAKYITSLTFSIPEEQIDATYDYICNLFVAYGFNTEEAIKYISENKEILSISKPELRAKLTLFSIIKKDKEALLENPGVLSKSYGVRKIYAAIKMVQAEQSEDPIKRIKNILLDNSLTEEKLPGEEKLTKERLSVLIKLYESQLAREIEENKLSKKGNL